MSFERMLSPLIPFGPTAQHRLLSECLFKKFFLWHIVLPADFHTPSLQGYWLSPFLRVPILTLWNGLIKTIWRDLT